MRSDGRGDLVTSHRDRRRSQSTQAATGSTRMPIARVSTSMWATSSSCGSTNRMARKAVTTGTVRAMVPGCDHCRSKRTMADRGVAAAKGSTREEGIGSIGMPSSRDTAVSAETSRASR